MRSVRADRRRSLKRSRRLGVNPILDQGYTSGTQDFAPTVLAIRKSGVDVIGTYMTYPADQAIFAKQLRQLGVSVQWVGSPTTVTVTARNLAGEALHGTYAVVDFNADANEAARAFTKQYTDRFGIAPDNFASWSYDALHILAMAINNAKSTEPEAIRNAILSIKGYKRSRKGPTSSTRTVTACTATTW